MRKQFGEEQYFEDFAVGDEFEAGPVTFSEDEIVEYARQFDPQRFHTDVEFAKNHFYKGLIASGFHVLSKTACALVKAGFLRGGGMGSPGLDALRWKKPVRPGDELLVVLRVLHTRPSGSRHDRGYVDFEFRALNGQGEVVMSYHAKQVLKRRPRACENA
jgi:acyl dehydratase